MPEPIIGLDGRPSCDARPTDRTCTDLALIIDASGSTCDGGPLPGSCPARWFHGQLDGLDLLVERSGELSKRPPSASAAMLLPRLRRGPLWPTRTDMGHENGNIGARLQKSGPPLSCSPHDRELLTECFAPFFAEAVH